MFGQVGGERLVVGMIGYLGRVKMWG